MLRSGPTSRSSVSAWLIAVLMAVLSLVVVSCTPGGGGAGETTSPTGVNRGYEY